MSHSPTAPFMQVQQAAKLNVFRVGTHTNAHMLYLYTGSYRSVPADVFNTCTNSTKNHIPFPSLASQNEDTDRCIGIWIPKYTMWIPPVARLRASS